MKKVRKKPKGEKKVEKGKIEHEIYMALIGLYKKERLKIIKISKHKINVFFSSAIQQSLAVCASWLSFYVC